MFRSILFIWLTFFFFYNIASAQDGNFNLIPNPSFEDANTCKKYDELCGPEAWRSTTLKLFYYLNDLNSKNTINLPVDGHRMISLRLHDKSRPANRSFVQVPLLCHLQKDSSYTLSFHFKPQLNNIGQFGIWFTDTLRISNNNGLYIGKEPDVKVILPDTLKEDTWIRVEKQFVAKANDKVLVLGNFTEEDSTQIIPFPREEKSGGYKSTSRTYYFFDHFHLSANNYSPSCDADQRRQQIYHNDVRHTTTNFTALFVQPPAPKMVEQAEDTPAPIVEVIKIGKDTIELNQVFELPNIRFASGEAKLLAIAHPALKALAYHLKTKPSLSVEITGHTDDQGTDEFNQELSERRANTVRNFLFAQGVNEDQISAKGSGSNAPIAENETEEGRIRNRRVEFRIVNKRVMPSD